jgi:hypothetical protein
MKDENAEVRIGVTKSVYDIFIASEQALLSSVPTILGTFQKDTQYKIREKTIETISRLGVAFGLDIFKAHFESLFFNYLTDTVASVRETGINCLEPLCHKFGSSWVVNNLIPKLMNYLTQPKTSYLHRMAVLHSVAVTAKSLNTNYVNDHVIPNLIKYLKDKIPNVRFYIIKTLSTFGSLTDSSGKDKIKR